MSENRATKDRAGHTREQILTAAERLFAEQGLFTVSNRQVSEAAGQGNNAAVGYHFGTKTDLIGAIVRRHLEPMEQIRRQLAFRYDGSQNPRDWVTCLVQPITDHLATLGHPTWYARFAAQVMTDPQHRAVIVDQALGTDTIATVVDNLFHCLPDLPPDVRATRMPMLRNLLVHTCAEQERLLADQAGSGGDPAEVWTATATALTDALTGILLAPVTR
ncbi:TetR/AcrR family transcriptional regulator [Winogradskya humida]|uniref:TetR family transcriptional regulator n=1 Tax=Winogradskya humida TaxID=113566 RepID=A0ABQ3ZE96_9ACTN|nr:TetR family transcriptional regulator [Actinoplanes humidus]GIE16907.1 TetR family transcriptional regulator [Actinoplanes humidus]